MIELEGVFREAGAAYQRGDLDAAESGFRRVLASVPQHAESVNALGAVACRRGRPEEGIELFRRAVALGPGNARFHGNLGRALAQANRVAEAAQVQAQAAALAPQDAAIHRELGETLTRLGRHAEAVAALQHAAELEPRDAAARRGLGTSLAAAGRLEEAEAACLEALAIDEDDPAGWNDLGNVLRSAGRVEEAEAALREALARRPDYVEAHNNLGALLMAENRLPEAQAALRQALACAPDFAVGHYNLGLALLLAGDLEAGLPEYEWRLVVKRAPPPLPGIPVWAGEPLEGSNIFVWAEQGVGDQVMFADLLPDLLATGAKAIVEADARLLPLLERSFPAIRFLARGVPATVPDSERPHRQVALGSLCRWLRPRLDRFPAHDRYLRADGERVRRLRDRYRARLPGRTLVGISWRGGSRGPDALRSIPLEEWAPILKLAGFGFVSLQYGEDATEVEEARSRFGVEVLSDPEIDRMNDLDGLAAQAAAMDLVLSIDNTTAHMAGALGRPVWILLPSAPNWRWRATGEHSHWYPTARLFRQPGRDDWDCVLAAVREALLAIRRAPPSVRAGS